MPMPRLRNAVPLLFLVSALALLLCPAPARAQVVLSAFRQDQQVQQPSSSVTLTATLTQPQFQGDWHIQSANINIDGTDYPATVGSTTGTGNGIATTISYVWDASSAGNPSEHQISASAKVQFEYEGPPSGLVDTISSTSPTYTAGGSTTAFYGDGREADLVIADIRLKSIGFTGNIGLTQNQTTPVATLEFTWDPASNSQTPSSPAAYVQGKTVGFTMTLCDSTGAALTGSATTGYTLKLTANPNATNAGTGQPVPPLTLYDNTTASPVAPTSFSGSSATVTATAALSGYVARYTTTFSPVTFYVQFTHVTPTPTWGVAGSCTPSGNMIYAVVATPTAPMATPWVPVLDYACKWATGATDAASATTALAKGLYNNGAYNGNIFYTDTPQDGEETFHLKNFLSNTARGGTLTGDCRVFADFLCCLSNGIGAKSLQVQRSAAVADISPNKDGHCHFFTKNFVNAPWDSSVPSPNSWDYHEWACSDVVFDACMGTTPTPLVNLTEPNYQSAVVDYTLSPHFFQAQSAFTPTIVN